MRQYREPDQDAVRFFMHCDPVVFEEELVDGLQKVPTRRALAVRALLEGIATEEVRARAPKGEIHMEFRRRHDGGCELWAWTQVIPGLYRTVEE